MAKRRPEHESIDKVHALLGESLWWAGKEKESLEVLKGLIENHPQSAELPRAYMFFGEYYLNRKNPKKAKEAFERSAEGQGSAHAACAAYRVACCHHAQADDHQAALWFDKARKTAKEQGPLRASALRALCVVHGMVPVEAGWFWMGCNPDVDKDCSFNEKPGRKVYLDEFLIDRTEVTIFEYDKCIRAGACSKEGLRGYPWPGVDDSYGPEWCERFGGNYCRAIPVVCVSWEQARSYCEWAGKRLPTEAEWEKAARGSDGRKYPWGNQGYQPGRPVANIADKKYGEKHYIPPVAKHEYDDGYAGVSPAGSFPEGASPYGALDTVGNTWEWVSDWYTEAYDQTALDRNPQGPPTGEYRVIRGCSSADLPRVCRASARFCAKPEKHKITIGFRCAADSVR